MTTLNKLTEIRNTMMAGGRLRLLPSNPKYAISDIGEVYSLVSDRPRQLMGYRVPGKYIQQAVGSRQCRTHHLVLESFIGPKPDGMEARHLDGDKYNNNANNLAWGTRSENLYDRIKHDYKNQCGEGHFRAKLTEIQVLEIRELIRHSIPYCDIGRIYGTSSQTIRSIAVRRSWKHLKEVSNA